MSHFTVMVIKRKGTRKGVDALLAPYDENLEVAPHVVKTRDELIKEGKEQIENLESKETMQDYLRDPVVFEVARGKDGAEYWAKEASYLKDYQTRKWEDEDYYAYATRYCEDGELDSEGNRISTYNRDSKWDWYVEGGRWTGLLKLKDGDNVDSAKAKDIDWDAMYGITKEQEEYQRKFWRAYVLNEKETDPELNEWYKEKVGFTYYKREYFTDKFGTVEEYIKHVSRWNTYAVVDCKGWYAPGEMGWFGVSTESEDEDIEWSKKFKEKFVDTLDPEDVITIVDCHI